MTGEVDLRDLLLRSLVDDLDREGDGCGYNSASVEDMVRFAEVELQVRLSAVPKLRAIFERAIGAAQRREILRLAILGPRGGGKTYLAAALEIVFWRFFGYDAHNLGGSLYQARRCYGYVRDAVETVRTLKDHLHGPPTMSSTVSDLGDEIVVTAASMTSVRGPHPHGSQGGGLLVIDESALVDDAIIDAALPMLSAADPSAVIQLSTMGEKQTGRWAEIIEDERHKGYTLESFDIFDVARTCPHECETDCPVRDHFWGNHQEGEAPGFYRDLGGGHRDYIHAAYCGGKAHEVNGHIVVDEIASLWENMDRSSFERELMGVNTGVVGRVYDPLLLTRASVDGARLAESYEDHCSRHLRLEKAIGLDWGWDGQTCAVYLARVRKRLVVYRWEFWSHTQFRRIKEHLVERCIEEGIEFVYADSAAPSDNDELREDLDRAATKSGGTVSPMLEAVVFSKEKDYGIGEVRRRLEREELVLPRTYGGEPVPNWERAVGYLRQYHTDDNGKPVKKDDHGPDALLCAVWGFSPRKRGGMMVR